MKNKFLLLFALLTFYSTALFAQTPAKPKLVVGIVIDQMRFDYLYRFQSNYGKDGFNRLMNEGTNFTYAHFNYVPLYTAPGHSSIYTGTTPYYHGIISNNWYDRKTGKVIYCCDDNSVSGVGTDGAEGKMSPKNLLSTTITDELKIASNGMSKVISVSLKDRGAILPGGHSADEVYWYDGDSGKFISSTYYMKSLPVWVEKFNERNLADHYLSKDWTTSLPADQYKINSPDDAKYEPDLFHEGKNTFPHSFKNIDPKTKYETFRYTPYGNQILLDFVSAILSNEKLDGTDATNFLAISFSSTDYIGHEYGPNSEEIEDTYIKLDHQIGELLKLLDKHIGKNNYLLFLTADHGAAEVPEHLKDMRIPAGNFDPKIIRDSVNSFTQRELKIEGIVEKFINKQIYLNYEKIGSTGLDLSEVEDQISNYLYSSFPEIAVVRKRSDLINELAKRNSDNFILNGFNFQRSGDIAVELQPNFQFNAGEDRVTHGTRNSYDSHVPLLFYGWKIPHQELNKPVYTIDIAPTISSLLHLTEPSSCIGKPILDALDHNLDLDRAHDLDHDQ